jgi:hypothetical protein
VDRLELLLVMTVDRDDGGGGVRHRPRRSAPAGSRGREFRRIERWKPRAPSAVAVAGHLGFDGHRRGRGSTSLDELAEAAVLGTLGPHGPNW